jgi:ABC-type multidrug transport system fused ATPase/permease subunit
MKLPIRAYWQLLARYLAAQRQRMASLAFLGLSSIAVDLASPQILRFFIDTAQKGGSQRVLVIAGLLFIGAALLGQVLEVGATWMSEIVAWTATNALRRDLAAHCLRLDMRFHNTHTPGELIERVDGDVTLLADFFSQLVIQMASNGLLIIGILLLLYGMDWRIGLTMSAFSIAVFALLLRIRGLSVPKWVAGREASAGLAGYIEERLAGTEDIRSRGATDYVMRHMYELMRDLYLAIRAAHLRGFVSAGIAFLALTIGTVLALAVSANLYLNREITIGSVYMVTFYAGMIGLPLRRITDKLDELQQASAGLRRVNELMDLPVTIADGQGVHLERGAPSIGLDHATFGYYPDLPVLTDVTFHLEPGHVLGLLGRTGSGKTTISRLLFRQYDPQSGSALLGGHDVRDFRVADLHDRVGLVTQDVQLFHATVRENLTFFDAADNDARIMDAVAALGLRRWYDSLPQGLDTLIAGSGGLSAGEAQMLALTRVFLKDPDVIILDEASSRLDPVTERLIEDAIDRLLDGRTAIIIAHRLATVFRADQILVLSDGRVLEFGRRVALQSDPDSHFSRLLRTGLEEAPA